MENHTHKSGFVSIVGKPNVGKSTLMNALLGIKLAIVSPKAQTTRQRILGIWNEPGHQVVFLDTPGYITPNYLLQQRMMGYVDVALEDAELIMLVVAPDEKFDEGPLFEKLQQQASPILLVVNKADLMTEEEILARIAQVKELVPLKGAVAVSAKQQFNLHTLKGAILEYLPEGPPFFDKEQLTDKPERFFVQEIVREKIFHHYEQEIPYSTEVSILLYEEREDLVYIDAEIHVERKSQKGILIGKGGQALKKIGTEARKEIEAFIGQKVMLKLYVRVTENWKQREGHLRNFGYDKPN